MINVKKYKDTITENYLDAEKQYYDYHTSAYTGDGDVIDTKHTGISFYDQFLRSSDIEYLRNKKNLKGTIVKMTPKEYYQECAYKIFGTSVEKLKRERGVYDRHIIDKLHNVLNVYKRKLCMPMINYAEKGQEGLHRMLAIAELFGWDHKVPVLVVDWYDEERHWREEKEARQHKIDMLVERAITETLHYQFIDLEDLTVQLQSELVKQFQYENDVFVPAELDVKENDEAIILTFVNKEYPIDREDIKWREDTDDLDDIDDIDLSDDFFTRYFGDDWKTEFPHLNK